MSHEIAVDEIRFFGRNAVYAVPDKNCCAIWRKPKAKNINKSLKPTFG